ncbi:MAG: DUF1329 domain-containing protein [Pseudomonadales bacterium]|nr:DUF1329 domain-containing protein [Pseudomonadales bacterium]
MNLSVKPYNRFKQLAWISALLTASVFFSQAHGAVTEEAAAQLGNNLTPVGAELAANKEGTIPAWSGGLTTPPAGYKSGEHPIDPFKNEKPIAVITQKNLDKHRDKLSAGQLAMFEHYPESYAMHIYTSHRTAAMPQAVYDDAKYNAVHTTLVDDGNGLTNFKGYIPFPIPNNGLEAIWNHIARYRGKSSQRDMVQIITQRNGSYYAVAMNEEVVYPENMDGLGAKADEMLVFFKQKITAPARLTGNVLLVHDSINQVKDPRKAWIYNAGQRRVRRAPQVAYDGPGTSSDSLRTSDNFDMYNGAPDRYNWKLLGKQELYIPYNSYKLASTAVKYDDIVRPGHMNPEHLRYELHRVWKVEATLKDGSRNIYSKRTFYIDEDSWQAAVVDHYDSRGNMWRLSEAYAMQMYYADVPFTAAQGYYDLTNNRYLVIGLQNEERDPVQFDHMASYTDFTPAAIRRSGKR